MALLLARVPFAAAVLTAEGRIRLANRAIADALGVSVEELVGEDLIERWASEPTRRASRSELALLAQGGQASARVRLGCPVLDVLQIEPIAGAPGFFLATGAGVSRSKDETTSFEVSTSPGEFGRVLRREAGGIWFDVPAGTRCQDLLCGASLCCAVCPAMALSEESPLVARATARGADGECYVVTARRSEPGRALVSAIRIDEATRARVVEARIDAVASEAALSDREKQVLRNLLLGRDLAEIAVELGISHRTVRFHQYNLLDKLGVESRADLARLLL